MESGEEEKSMDGRGSGKVTGIGIEGRMGTRERERIKGRVG